MDNDNREGLWDPERPAKKPAKRKRALPKSRVTISLLLMLALVVIAAFLGIIF